MTFDIIACGESGANWPGKQTLKRLAIGVNDARKFGKETFYTLVANHPTKFESDRLKTIAESKCTQFYANSDVWKQYHPSMIKYRTESWNGLLIKNRGLTTMSTSPVIAMHLAWQLGAEKIVLWGVDFNTHPVVSGSHLKQEIRQYKGFIDALKNNGVEVQLGCEGSVFQEFLTIES